MCKILIVENDSSWFGEFKKILQILGESREIIRVDLDDLLKEYSTTSEFDGIDHCLIDLELGPAINPNINDTHGLNKALPHIRDLAPWLPCACISRFITGDSEVVDTLSVSDFDGLFPKSVIYLNRRTNPSFNQERWQKILVDLSIRRTSSLSGISVTQLKKTLSTLNSIELKISDSVACKNIIKNIDSFKQALAILNIIGTTISVDDVIQGFSGINVSRITVYGEDSKGQIKSNWLLKWGKPIRKLNKEATAHKLMYQRGLHRSLMIPLLIQNVISWEGIGYIAYAYEEDAITAYDLAIKDGIDSISVYIEKIFNLLYSRKKQSPVSVSSVLTKWVNLNIDELESIGIKDITRNYEVSCSLIHGDLHLRNIMIKDNQPVLIDFARSEFAPVAIDAAKFFIDTIAFLTHSVDFDKNNFDFDHIYLNPDYRKTFNVFKTHFVNKDDILLFNSAIKAYAKKYLSYPDITETNKSKLRKLLND